MLLSFRKRGKKNPTVPMPPSDGDGDGDPVEAHGRSNRKVQMESSGFGIPRTDSEGRVDDAMSLTKRKV